jgi:hypothetical protein
MSGPKNMNARERARLATEQAAARKRDRRILIMMIAAFVVIVVAGGIAFQAWRTGRAPSTVPSASVSASPITHSSRLARGDGHDHLVRGLPLPALCRL